MESFAFTENKKSINLFCDIIHHYKNKNEDTKFFVLFNRNEFNITIKFKVLSDILTNLFVSSKVKNILLELFCKSQRIYYVLSKFAHKYQFRKAKLCVDTDLCLNTIDIGHRKTIPIFDKKTRSVFLFTCADLINIIMTALTHTTNFFIEVAACKNPYTNLPFEKSNLYTIYFHIQENYPVIPPLLYSFFMCHFDSNVFMIQNEQAIRNIIVKNYMKNTSTSTLFVEVLHMLHFVHSRFSIDPKFPQYLLVEIMRPYLYLYLMFMYSVHGSEQRGIYYVILRKKMDEFFSFNSNFGRKRVDKDRTSNFNSNYPNFTIKHIHELIQNKIYMNWYSHWNTWDIPNPYTSQLMRLYGNLRGRVAEGGEYGYSPSLYRTDVDYDEENDYTEDAHADESQNTNTQESIPLGENINQTGNQNEVNNEESSSESEYTQCDNNDSDCETDDDI